MLVSSEKKAHYYKKLQSVKTNILCLITKEFNGKLQTPAATLKEIQLPTWKKQRVESLIYLLYYHTSGSTINISLAGMFTSNIKTLLAILLFQSKQKKVELLETYGDVTQVEKPKSYGKNMTKKCNKKNAVQLEVIQSKCEQ
ncbi:hypothetical protein G9A89_023057 [Geosiphon pyriformis]|nr:hypothetical protein G9A89_023057 [Geosiphon pyriformis]